MSCANYVTNEDGEPICPCGDEGRSCESCKAAEEAYWAAEFRRAPLSEIDPERYAQELRDAGRGHLVKP